MYETIKRWYKQGLWSALMVKQAVKQGKITEEQYKEITGFVYPATK